GEVGPRARLSHGRAELRQEASAAGEEDRPRPQASRRLRRTHPTLPAGGATARRAAAAPPFSFGQVRRVMSKTLYIKTYGCQMNVYDSERMAAAMAASDYTEVDTPEDADLVILNTCHIREKAAEKVYSELGRLK